MTNKRIITTITGHIAQVQLNRPDKKNALDMAMFEELIEAGEALKKQSGVRVVILSGSGGCFCSGIDTSSFMEMAANIDQVRKQMLNPGGDHTANQYQRPVTVWQELEIPVIAVIEGVAFGGGMQLALAADFRIAAPDARFSIMESRWGLIPDMGITQSLPALLPADRAKELIMTARILDAQEALSYNLITRIASAPHAAAQELAQTLADKSPDVIRASKTLVNRCWGSSTDSLRLEAQLQAPIIGSENQIEAVMAGMQKRTPNFK